MKMTLEEAKECLASPLCAGCKYADTDYNCYESAREIGIKAIDYMLKAESKGADIESD